MATFGQSLRYHRRQSRDPQRGGPLTQERLGELLGERLGDAGYSGAAVSEWERDKSKIDEDNRPVLVALVEVLHQNGGLASPDEADALLHAGNYRALDPAERTQLFPGLPIERAPGRSAAASTGRSLSKERRKQLILLNKVRSFWVEGVLETSAPGDAGFRPLWRQVDEFVEQPWQDIVRPSPQEWPGDGRESPLSLYDDSDRSLLILGEPGAGKTIMLLTLARALINRAVEDPSRPIPVILSLMTWAKRRRPLEEWVVDELASKYMIPRQTGRQWLEDDDLILLLDSFDDVPRRLRRRCALAVNAFRPAHGLSGIVVCGRTEEYATAGVKLKLGAAIELQPLEDGQIDGYLEGQGARLEPLWSAVDRDESLHEMARNPLMLSIMSQAYDDAQTETFVAGAEEPFSPPAPLATRRQRLFGLYVRRMFRRRAMGSRYSAEQTTVWLSWLARQMYRFQQTPMLLEHIQPSWLPNRRWRMLYVSISSLIAGLFTAFVIWMLLQILRMPTPELGSATAGWLASGLGMSETQAEALMLIALNLLLALVFALMQGRYFEAMGVLPEDSESDPRRYRQHVALVVLVIGGLVFALASFKDSFQFALAWATAEAFIFSIIIRYVFGVSYNSEIRTLESLGWSWSSAVRGFGVGLVAAVVFEVMESLIFENDGVHLSIIIPAVGGMVLGGMRGRRVEAKSWPNQGIVLSLRNSFIAATISGLILAALALYVRKEAYDREYALRVGLLTFAVAGALFGGGNVIKHYLVRTLLWLHKDLPWNVIRFLDHAADLVFMRKVGGGYIFIHRLLQQHFASLHQPREEDSSQTRLASDRQQAASGSR